jgi:hypothetical protein
MVTRVARVTNATKLAPTIIHVYCHQNSPNTYLIMVLYER